jgi:hypothetical protein
VRRVTDTVILLAMLVGVVYGGLQVGRLVQAESRDAEMRTSDVAASTTDAAAATRVAVSPAASDDERERKRLMILSGMVALGFVGLLAMLSTIETLKQRSRRRRRMRLRRQAF